MVRWVAFDDDTAEAVVSKFRRGAAEIRDGESPLDAALSADSPSVVILPSPIPGKVLLANVKPKTGAVQAKSSPVLPFSKASGGMQAPSPKGRRPQKRWYRRSA